MELKMDKYDFAKIDREIVRVFPSNRNLKMETVGLPPRQYEWISIGEYDGIDLPDIFIDENYIVWQQVKNLECNCEVIQ
jgi:hypothetical protein